jgi:hypothetical protein
LLREVGEPSQILNGPPIVARHEMQLGALLEEVFDEGASPAF